MGLPVVVTAAAGSWVGCYFKNPKLLHASFRCCKQHNQKRVEASGSSGSRVVWCGVVWCGVVCFGRAATAADTPANIIGQTC
jgi:hypothetical protein